MRYKIIDIIHTGHHGPRGESKVGYKYDARRDMIIHLNIEDCVPGEHIIFRNDNDFVVLLTTAFDSMAFVDGYLMLETLNSIYKLEKLDAE